MEEGPSECSLLISLQTQPRCPFLSTKCWKDTAESPDGLAGGSSKPTAAYLGEKGAGGKHSQVFVGREPCPNAFAGENPSFQR